MTDREEKLREAAEEIGELVAEKNRAYGDSALTSARALELLYPEGIEPKDYTDVLLISRVWDKLKRIATDREALGENPWQDIVGYGLLGVVKDEERERASAWEPRLSRSFFTEGKSQEPDLRAVVEAIRNAPGTPGAMRQAAGSKLCVGCGYETFGVNKDPYICEKCMQALRKERRDQGRCLECGVDLPNTNASLCSKCREKQATQIVKWIIGVVQKQTTLPVTSSNLVDHIVRFFEDYNTGWGPLMPYARDGEKFKDTLKRIFEEGEAKSFFTNIPDLKLRYGDQTELEEAQAMVVALRRETGRCVECGKPAVGKPCGECGRQIADKPLCQECAGGTLAEVFEKEDAHD